MTREDSMNEQIKISELEKKIDTLNLLKDYALSKNLEIPDELIKNINVAVIWADRIKNGEFDHQEKHSSLDILNKVDIAIKDLTSITYPTNINTILLSTKNMNYRNFKITICASSLFGLFLSIYCYALLGQSPKLLASFLSAALGLLGSSIFIIFNLMGILSEKAFDSEDTFSNYARLFIGPILGWLFYFAFCQKSYNSDASPIILIAPFLAGFSTKLVVGVINQAIKAFELTLGLEEKGKLLTQRNLKRNNKYSNRSNFKDEAM